MKNRIIACMVVLMMFLSNCITPPVFAADTYIFFDGKTMTNVSSNKLTGTSVPALDTTMYKVGNSSLKFDLTSFNSSGNDSAYVNFNSSSEDDFKGGYLYCWVYLTAGDIPLFRIKNSDDSVSWYYYCTHSGGTGLLADTQYKTITGSCIGTTGWYLIEFKASSKATPVNFFIQANGATAKRAAAKYGGPVYVGLAWLSKTQFSTEAKSFGATSLKDGVPVRTDVDYISVEAQGIQSVSEGEKFITITPEANFEVIFEENIFKIDFNSDSALYYGTNYTISISEGFCDTFGIPFTATTLEFRTLREDENLPPNVYLDSPIKGERYYPGDTVTLSATAFDDDGSISLVEFYKDGNLIEGSGQTEGTDNVYSFDWEVGMEEGTFEISAVAYDNENTPSESEKVKIVVMDYKTPEISVDVPEYIYSCISGIDTGRKLSITTVTSDEDDNISKIEVFIDGDCVVQETSSFEGFTYTHNEILADGEHIVNVVVTDEDGLYAEKSATVTVMKLGVNGDSVSKGKLEPASWTHTGKSVLASGCLLSDSNISGLVMVSDKPASSDKSILSKGTVRNLSSKFWMADLQIAFGDTEHNRSIAVSGTSDLEMLSFSDDGKIYAGGEDTGLEYAPGRIYDVKLIFDPLENIALCMIDDVALYDDMTAIATLFSSGANIKVSQTSKSGAYGELCITNFGIYELGEAAEISSVKLYDESNNEIADLNNVSVYAEKIAVSFTTPLTANTLSNVVLKSKNDGKRAKLTVENGAVRISEKLKENAQYQLVIGFGVKDTEGKGLCGDEVIDFKTTSASVSVDEAETAFKIEGVEVPELNTSLSNVDFVTKLTMTSDAPEKITVVGVLYNGNSAKVFTKEYTRTEVIGNDGRVEVNMTDLTILENSYIEAFITDSLDSMSFLYDYTYKLN